MYRLNYYYQRWRAGIIAAATASTKGQIVIGGPKGVQERVNDAILTFNYLHKIVDHYTVTELGEDKMKTLQQVCFCQGSILLKVLTKLEDLD